MLAQSVVAEYGERATFVVENYGASELAKRFGVRRYPAIFVGDVLVATPKDFGFYGKGEGAGEGRYAPIRSAASHERFRADLARAIDRLLEGREDLARAAAASPEGGEVDRLPEVTLTDLDGRAVPRAALANRAVLVELWATWCPPCRGTLAWLGDLARRHGDRLAVVALAVESDSAEVRRVAERIGGPIVWGVATPEIARAFGDVSAVPTLLLFDAEGRASGAVYGAPPGMHERAEKTIAAILAKR